MFFVELPKLADLTTRHSLENVLVIRSVLHQLVDFLHRAFAVPLGQPLQKIGGDVIARVPATPTGTPMWGLETGTEADPICYALDKAARAGALAVVLETVDDLVYQNTADLVCTTVRGVDDVLARKMNLLCRFRAGRIGYAIHGPKDKLYSLHVLWRLVRRYI